MLLRTLLFLLLTFGSSFGGGRTAATAQTFHTTVPYRNENGKLLVTAEVNGRRGRFLLDTGAPCCLTHSFATAIGLSDGVPQQAHDSNGQTVATRLIVIDSLRFGAVTFHQLQAMRLPEGDLTERFGIDGIIGYNLLRMGIVQIDEKTHRITFTTQREATVADESPALPLLPSRFLTLIPLQLGTVVDTVMFDSGAADFYEMAMRHYPRLAADTTAVKRLGTGRGILSFGAGGLETPSTKHRLNIPSLSLGKAFFRNVSALTTDARESRLGTALLHYGCVVIDYRNRRFHFRPYDDAAVPDLYVPEWDVVITVMDDRLTAGMVWDARLPIRAGDRIVEINGRTYDKVNLYEATTSGLIEMAGDTAVIGYIDASDNTLRRITIRRH